MTFKGGVKEAAKILSGLDANAQERVLNDISKKDPSMAEALRENMVTFSDLKYLTVKMLAELLQEINIGDLALGLRIADQELKKFILQNISKNMREEVEGVLLGPPRSVNHIHAAIEKVMAVVRKKVGLGQLVFNKGSETLV